MVDIKRPVSLNRFKKQLIEFLDTRIWSSSSRRVFMSTIRSPSLFKDIILLLTYTVRRFKRKRVVVVEAIIIAVVLFFYCKHGLYVYSNNRNANNFRWTKGRLTLIVFLFTWREMKRMRMLGWGEIYTMRMRKWSDKHTEKLSPHYSMMRCERDDEAKRMRKMRQVMRKPYCICCF